MPPFKIKFTAHPQHDAEGFTVMDAKCRGCEPTEMCPRSGHCERYMSPLREIYPGASHVAAVLDRNSAIWAKLHNGLDVREDRRQWGITREDEISTTTAEEKMAVAAIFLREPVKLSEMTDAELNDVHSDWLRRGRAE